MIQTLAVSLSLKNTYQVNCIMYAIKQTPIINRFLPDDFYGAYKVKLFANVLSILWEIMSTFAVKLLYFGAMLIWAMCFYPAATKPQLFFHILIFLTVLGSFTNTYIFKPKKDKYYALMLLRMDSRYYAVSNYSYYILKTFIGFAAMGALSSCLIGLPILQSVLIPFFVVGLKLDVVAILLKYYEHTGNAPNEDKINYIIWGLILLLLLCAYGLPLLGVILPIELSTVLMAFAIAGSFLSVYKVCSFRLYHSLYRQILSQAMCSVTPNEYNHAEQAISFEPNIYSSKKGADYLNALFVKRHRKVLWRSSNQIALGFMALTVVLLLISYLCPSKMQLVLSKWSPSFLFFMMYLVNRGGSFTKALYMNCDYSLLNYNFFKKADLVFKLFIIRLRELIKINILPALSIGMGLGVIMYANGIGKVTDYILWILLAMCLSAFFSVHYLLMYYLLQPYTSGTDVKSGHYRILEIAPFFIFLRVIKIKISSIFLGVISIGMCVLYYFIAISLVRKYSTDTFRQRV